MAGEVDWHALQPAPPGHAQVDDAEGDGDAHLATEDAVDERVAPVVVVVGVASGEMTVRFAIT